MNVLKCSVLLLVKRLLFTCKPRCTSACISSMARPCLLVSGCSLGFSPLWASPLSTAQQGNPGHSPAKLSICGTALPASLGRASWLCCHLAGSLPLNSDHLLMKLRPFQKPRWSPESWSSTTLEPTALYCSGQTFGPRPPPGSTSCPLSRSSTPLFWDKQVEEGQGSGRLWLYFSQFWIHVLLSQLACHFT